MARETAKALPKAGDPEIRCTRRHPGGHPAKVAL